LEWADWRPVYQTRYSCPVNACGAQRQALSGEPVREHMVKLASFNAAGRDRLGVLLGDGALMDVEFRR
jgi:hypothetical protein